LEVGCLAQESTEGSEARAGDTGSNGLAPGLQKEAIEFQFAAGFEVNQGGGLIRAHLARALDLAVGGGWGHVQAQGPRGGDGFEH
jgi:hypothetical protein